MSEQPRESAGADRRGGGGRSANERREAGIPSSSERGPSGPARQRQERK